MKIILSRYFLFATMIFLTACTNTWDGEQKRLFHQSCMEVARENGKDEIAAKSMCDCRLEKIMAKYPRFDDALKHVDDIMHDEDLKDCK